MPIYGAGTVVWDPHRPKAPDVVLIILVQHPKVLRATSSGETFDNECPARVTASTQHFSRLSFRLTYCCLWISNVQVQACGDAGEHPLESNRMLQLLPWPGAVRLSRRDDRKNCTWAASRIKGAELTAKREKKKQLCTRPKILRRRLEYIQVCWGLEFIKNWEVEDDIFGYWLDHFVWLKLMVALWLGLFSCRRNPFWQLWICDHSCVSFFFKTPNWFESKQFAHSVTVRVDDGWVGGGREWNILSVQTRTLCVCK